MSGIKILCFGDSLTSGWFNFGLGEHPYAETLAERLRAAFPFPVSVKVSGAPGDLVCTERWVDRAKAERQFDIPIIFFLPSSRHDYLLHILGFKMISVLTRLLHTVEKDKYTWAIVLGGTKYVTTHLPSPPSPSSSSKSAYPY